MNARKNAEPVQPLRPANGLKSSLIREKSALRVPVATRGPVSPGPRLRVPARRIPPPASDRPLTPDAEASRTEAQPPPTK